MNRLKIYLDTSVISHLEQHEQPEKREDTLKLWEEIKQEKYEVVISSITRSELLGCTEPKRSILIKHLESIKYEFVDDEHKMNELATEIIKRKILKEGSRDDAKHIGAAIISNCDVIVSWNFKHLVNIKTINGVREVVISNHCKFIDIVTPPTIINAGDDEL